MLNLIKTIFRSGKKSIMLVIFFILLIMSASLTFGALYGTANSMQTTYDKIKIKNRLHQFTIQEKYDIGKVIYKIIKNEKEQKNNYIQPTSRVLMSDHAVKVYIKSDSMTNSSLKTTNEQKNMLVSYIGFLLPSKFKTLKKEYQLADIPKLLTYDPQDKKLYTSIFVRDTAKSDIKKKTYSSLLQNFGFAIANTSNPGDGNFEMFTPGESSINKYTEIIQGKTKKLTPNKYFYTYTYVNKKQEKINLFVDVNDILAYFNAIVSNKHNFEYMIAATLEPDIAATSNLIRLNHPNLEDATKRIDFIKKSFDNYLNPISTNGKNIGNKSAYSLSKEQLKKVMLVNDFFVSKKNLALSQSDNFESWKTTTVPQDTQKVIKMIDQKIARYHKGIFEIKTDQNFPKNIYRNYYVLKNELNNQLKVLKRKKFYNDVYRYTDINLKQNLKSTISASSFSSIKAYKMIRYNPQTNTDLLPFFNKAKTDIFENINNWEKHATHEIENGKNKVFNRDFFPLSKNAMPKQIIRILLQMFTKSTIEKLTIKEKSYGLEYSYEQKVGGSIALLPIGGKKLNVNGITIVSKAYNIEYLKSFVAIANQQAVSAQHKKTISPKNLSTLYQWWRNKKINGKILNAQSSINDFINSGLISKDSIVSVRGLNYILVGEGNTPDFSYPIIDSAHPIPDFKKQMLLYISNAGMDRFKKSFSVIVSNDYIAGRYKENQLISNTEEQKLMKKIIMQDMSWNNSSSAFRSYDQNNDDSFLVSQRINHINRVVEKITIISIISMIIIGIFSGLIALSIISKFLADKSKSFGILKANGMSSVKIAFSLTIFIAIISLISSITGFVIGTFLQKPLFSLIGDFWTLPTKIIRFDINGFLIVIFVMVFLLTLLGFLRIFWKIRVPALTLIRDTNVSSQSRVFSKLKKIFKSANIKVKYGVALSMSSIGKLTGFTFSIIASAVVIIFSLTSINIFKVAENQTTSKHNYKYKVDLMTPTMAGGLYARSTWDNISRNMSYYGEKEVDGDNQTRLEWDEAHPNRPLWESDAYKAALYGTNRSTNNIWDIFERYNNGSGDSGASDDFVDPLLKVIPDFAGLDSTWPTPTSYLDHNDGFIKQKAGYSDSKDGFVKWEGLSSKSQTALKEMYYKTWWMSKQWSSYDPPEYVKPGIEGDYAKIKKSWLASPNNKKIFQNIVQRPDFQRLIRNVSSIKYNPQKPNEFNPFLPTIGDEMKARSDINFLRNKYVTREFVNGNFGGSGLGEISISQEKNLWTWVMSTLSQTLALNASDMGEKFSIDAFNANLASLHQEYINSLSRKIETNNRSYTVEELLGHKVLIEHAFIKWKAFKDKDNKLAIETGQPAVRFDRVAAYNQRPEKNIIWSGGLAKSSFVQDYNPYFAYPVDVSPGDANVVYLRNMGLTQLAYNINLQNIFQHFATPVDPYTRLVPLGISIKETFFDYIRKTLQTQDSKGNYIYNNQFRMFYGGIPINDRTEIPYTYINTKIMKVDNQTNFKSKIENIKTNIIKINGINTNAKKYIYLKNLEDKDVFDNLQNAKAEEANGQKIYPIMINAVLAKSLNVTKGDTITMNVLNSVDNVTDKTPHQAKFKIIDVLSTYRGFEIYTSQNYANQITGISRIQGPENRKFNGVISNDPKSKLLFNSVVTYSKSGMYAIIKKILDDKGAEGKVMDPTFRNFFIVYGINGINPIISTMKNNILMITKSLITSGVDQNKIPNWHILIPEDTNPRGEYWKYVKKKLGNKVIDQMNQQKYGEKFDKMLKAQNEMAVLVRTTYGDTFVKSAITDADFYQISSKIFKSYAHTANSFELIIIIFSLIIVVIVILTITTILITSNTKSFATLKILGYKKRDISKIFLTIYLPFLILGIIIGIALSFLVVYFFVDLTLKGTQILLPLSISFWSILAMISIILGIFFIAFGLSIRKINNIDALKVLK